MNKQEIHVILVDEANNEVGTIEKLEAHEKGMLHRAFSVFLFNENGELLLQRRDIGKYHCGGLWTNTVCSHQFIGENNLDAGERRLKEEMGIELSRDILSERGSLVYKAEFENGLTEHEYDFVITGSVKSNLHIDLNPEEVMDYSWKSITEIQKDIEKNPDIYTPWFKIIMSDKKYLDIFKNYES